MISSVAGKNLLQGKQFLLMMEMVLIFIEEPLKSAPIIEEMVGMTKLLNHYQRYSFLMMIEFGSLNVQSALGMGVCNIGKDYR